MGGFFPPNPRPVEPSPEAKGDGPAADVPHGREAAKAPKPAQGMPRRATAKAAPTLPADDAPYYRSVRSLSRAVIVGNVVTAVSVISLALIFASSQQRLWEASQARLVALTERLMATNDTLTAKLEQSSAAREKSESEIAQLKQATVRLEQTNAAYGDRLTQMLDELAEQRLKELPVKLTNKDRITIARNLTLVSPKIKDVSAKRAADALKESLRNNEDRAAIHKKLRQLRNKLDEPVGAEIDDKVWKPFVEAD